MNALFDSKLTIYTLAAFVVGAVAMTARGAAPHSIVIDGSFNDWSTVQSYVDPTNDETVDWHDPGEAPLYDPPNYPDYPDIDILEYKFTHDQNNLYAYFKSRGVIGNTQVASGDDRAGRFYVIVTIDVDNDNTSGYELSDGGYFPSSNGYDMNMEIEFYDGAFNTGHYLNHSATEEDATDPTDDEKLPELEAQQQQGIVDVRHRLPGSYDYYTQWVMFDDPSEGDHDLGDGTSITFVKDKGPVYQGIIEAALSPDGHELEMIAPFVGFMSYPGATAGQRGDPIMQLGRTIDISFSLEGSGELTTPPGHPDPNGEWGSDTAAPIVSYYLAVPEPSSAVMGLAMFCGIGALSRRRGLGGR